MNNKAWKNLFAQTIRSRGLEYYNTGCVEDLEWDEDVHILTATVQGSVPYEVEIHFASDTMTVDAMFCDCPYADGGDHCKHMAAVLYEFSEQKRFPTEGSAKTAVASEGTDAVTIEAAVERLSEVEAKTYLLECVKQDEDLRDRILLRAQPTVTATQQKQWKKDLKKLAPHLDYRYTDIDDIYEYEEALSDFLDLRVPILLEKSLVAEAFDLVCLVYEEYRSQDLSCFGEWTSDLSSICDEHWYAVIEAAEPPSSVGCSHGLSNAPRITRCSM